MADQVAVRREFELFLGDLTSVEKKVISALTDVARDILRTRPQGAPAVVAAITDRVLQAPVALKLPTLYLLDSIVKLIGEPYTSYFSPLLPEAFATTWAAGNGNLHKSLQKLYNTWTGVFSPHVLAEVAARLGRLTAAAPAAPAVATAAMPIYYPSMQPASFAAAEPPLQPYGFAQLMSATTQPPLQQGAYSFMPQEVPQQPLYVQQPQQVVLPRPAFLPQQQQPQPQPAAAQPVDVADLMASLVNSGILAVPAATAPPSSAAAVQLPAAGGGLEDSTPSAAGTPLRPEECVSLEFTPERIKDKNPAAVCRLLEQTEHTKGQFLDRKFLRRQRRTGSSQLRVSRLWYVDLDTWMASTLGGLAAAEQQEAAAAAATAAAAPEQCTVPVDHTQTHCALSGEKFQQFWDERHQEWRYRDTKRLDVEEAARYGLEEGALVLVSAMGEAPAASLLQPTAGGVLSAMKTEQEIAADLAAAAAAVGLAAVPSAADAKEDIKPLGLKHEREEGLQTATGGAAVPEQKRLRVH